MGCGHEHISLSFILQPLLCCNVVFVLTSLGLCSVSQDLQERPKVLAGISQLFNVLSRVGKNAGRGTENRVEFVGKSMP